MGNGASASSSIVKKEDNTESKRGLSGVFRKGKEKWIKRELGLDINSRAIFSHDKYEYANKGGEPTILIDDYDKNIRLFKEHGGITIHHLGDLSSTLGALEDLKNGHSYRNSNRRRTQEERG